jgi:hypothetical protein
MKFTSIILGLLLQAPSPSSAFLSVPHIRISKVQLSSSTASDFFSPPSSSETFSNAELETAFFSIDIENKGSISRSCFAEAIHDLGVDLPRVQTDLLFDKYDADKGGSIDMMEFKEVRSGCNAYSSFENGLMDTSHIINPLHRVQHIIVDEGSCACWR